MYMSILTVYINKFDILGIVVYFLSGEESGDKRLRTTALD